MDYKDSKRKTKKDKAKEHNERNGGKSTRHIRAIETRIKKATIQLK